MYTEEMLDLSFDCVLPSSIFFNENLEPNCIRFYAIVRNLTRLQGYCYASNSYLAKLLGADESSIRRWLSSLNQEGFLKVETNKDGIYWQRRIYLADDFKKCLRKLKNEHPPAQFRAPPRSKISTIKKEKNKEGKENPSPLPTPSKSSNPKTKEDWRGFFSDWSKEEFEYAWEEYEKAPPGSVKSIKAWLPRPRQRYIEMNAAKGKSEANLKKASELATKHSRQANQYAFKTWKGMKVTIHAGHVMFTGPKGSYPVSYAISDEEWEKETGWKA